MADWAGLCGPPPPGGPDAALRALRPAEVRAVAVVAAGAAGDRTQAWAAQGVLLLELLPAGAPGAEGWRAYLAGLVRALAAGDPGLLLAVPAGEGLAAGLPALDAAAFRAAAGRLRPPLADPQEALFLGCDGSCLANGRASGRGGYAVAACGGALAGAAAAGGLEPRLYRLRDPARPEAGLEAHGPAGAAPATNNRAELLGLCWALLLVLAAGGRGAARIYCDSLLAIRTLTEWLPARRRRGTAGELKNPDLLAAAAGLWEAARARCALQLCHVPGHGARPPGGEALLAWTLNDRADRAAQAAAAAGAPPRVDSPHPPLRRLAEPAPHAGAA